MGTLPIYLGRGGAPGLALALALTLGACLAAPSPEEAAPGAQAARPLVIAHRGASGEFPEHTLVAYEAAIRRGADFIEPDLVMTRDERLVARHDRYLSTTTDVASRPEFARRRRMGKVGGQVYSDWFVEDFTLAELKTLQARQPRPGRSKAHDGRHAIPTFAEILDLAARLDGPDGPVGVYPELKVPDKFAARGLDIEAAFLQALGAHRDPRTRVIVQCFEPATLKSLDRRSDLTLVQLLPASDGSALEFAEIAAYADGIGPWKALMAGAPGGPAGFVARAHSAGLSVHAYTYRDDDVAAGFATIEAELASAFDSGLDGVFTDFPATAADLRDRRTPR